ncbi:hypothetical protein [Massilia sp. CCM 8734]|uniref:hypothetical protein n=1 Tax=Massilia sp. CCM 8734 TaxID=2609283 RepID=UPI001422A81F|nr:hypothetical protein [Massilia sp. CCM 8734]NHZ97569.1 hypothetical protein [Massilia sp. CCM 8734]
MSNNISVKFDVADCTLREQSEDHFGWSNANGVYIVLRVPKNPTNWSFDPHDIDAATRYFSQQSASNGGALLEMDVVSAGGHTALRGLFKYRSPLPDSMGMMFVSILWIRLGNATAQINVESVEQGTTGVREATVCVMTGESPTSASPSEPVLMDSVEDMFAHMRAQPLQVFPSDNSQYDQMFPDHPLSKVRHRMAQLEATLSIATAEAALAASGQAPWWKFW